MKIRSVQIHSKIDAVFSHLYGINHNDVDYIKKNFPIVKKNDEKEFGEYRTKNLFLEIYYIMKHAIDTGTDYQTILDSPPADSRVAHTFKVDQL